jgi:hypothetical protein
MIVGEVDALIDLVPLLVQPVSEHVAVVVV